MFLALAIFVAATAPDIVDVLYRGRPISAIPCNQGVTVTDVHATPAADVAFHNTSAELMFEEGESSDERTLFVYVDGVQVALITAKGPVRMIVPLDRRPHHKIVTGNSGPTGGLRSAWARCN